MDGSTPGGRRTDSTPSGGQASILRRARISRDSEGEPIGVAVFITADELTDLGVDTAADAVTVAVENELLRLNNADNYRQVDLEIEGETNSGVEK